MSSDLPFGFGTGDPSQPFDMQALGAAFQQFGQMLSSAPADSGPVAWTIVEDVARKALQTTGDPVVAEAELRSIAAAVQLANHWLDEACTFPECTVAAQAWSRAQWLESTMPVWRRVVEPIATQMQNAIPANIPAELSSMLGPLLGMVQQLSSVAFSNQLGNSLAGLAREVVSASDIGIPLTESPVVALVPSNATQFGEGLEVAADDVRLYLALRECAHQRLFAHVPWLRARAIGALEAYVAGLHVDQDRLQDMLQDVDFANPEAMQELMTSGLMTPEDTEEQRAALARLETLLALVEGWVDDVVTEAAKDRLPAAVALRESMRRRRAAGGPAEKAFGSLVGLELRPRALREAASLFAAVRSQGDASARDALWGHPDLLPDAEDLKDPLGFIERSQEAGEEQ
ncbi:MAG: zinc-dependent metalloprotease [Actinomycetota bacterium]|nr:zinc-dependent metalloprotease [Actinomycetota bacterium]MDP2289130.1 zinc-dependent metalloprotease [Actinomycetota bacterium]